MLGMLKMEYSAIRKAIMSVNDDVLSDNLLSQLLNYIPTPEEEKALEPFSKNPAQLASADQFFVEILQIPRYEQRLRALAFRKTLSDKLLDIRPVRIYLAGCYLAYLVALATRVGRQGLPRGQGQHRLCALPRAHPRAG